MTIEIYRRQPSYVAPSDEVLTWGAQRLTRRLIASWIACWVVVADLVAVSFDAADGTLFWALWCVLGSSVLSAIAATVLLWDRVQAWRLDRLLRLRDT